MFFFSNIIIVFNREIVIIRTERCFFVANAILQSLIRLAISFWAEKIIFLSIGRSHSHKVRNFWETNEIRRKKCYLFLSFDGAQFMSLDDDEDDAREFDTPWKCPYAHVRMRSQWEADFSFSALSPQHVITRTRVKFSDSKRREEMDRRDSIRCRQIPLRHIIERWEISIYNF